jgi:small subunit ribosomal protein S4e
MDVLSMPDLKKFYRILPSHKGLFHHLISEEEASFKLARVEGKTVVKNGIPQISLHDGSTLLGPLGESEVSKEVVYETFDTVKLGLPGKEVQGKMKTRKGNMAIITGGKNIGKQGKIIEIEKTVAKKRRNALVVVEDEKGGRYQTILDFVFSIGEAKSLISLLEAT